MGSRTFLVMSLWLLYGHGAGGETVPAAGSQLQAPNVRWPIQTGAHESQSHVVVLQPTSWIRAKSACCELHTGPAFLKNEGYFTSARNELSNTANFPAGAWNESGDCVHCTTSADGQPACYMHVWIGLADNNKQGSSATDIAGWTPYHTPPFSDLVKDFVWVDPGCNGSSLLASTDYLLSGYTQYGGVNEYFSANSTSHGGYCTALQFCPGVENSAAITFMPCDYKTAFMCTEQLVTPPLTPDRASSDLQAMPPSSPPSPPQQPSPTSESPAPKRWRPTDTVAVVFGAFGGLLLAAILFYYAWRKHLERLRRKQTQQAELPDAVSVGAGPLGATLVPLRVQAAGGQGVTEHEGQWSRGDIIGAASIGLSLASILISILTWRLPKT